MTPVLSYILCMKKLLLLSTLLLAACAGSGKTAQNPDPNHTHADFAVWILGEKIDFSDAKYMSGYEDDHDHEHVHLHEYYHLHDGVGNVIHRHKPGLPLEEFLESVGMEIGEDCVTFSGDSSYCSTDEYSWIMAVNGDIRQLDGGYVFEDTDHILLSYGATADEVRSQIQQLTDDSCLYSRTCPERGDPPAENCIADPAVPCVAPVE